jgi:hypothetical protein
VRNAERIAWRRQGLTTHFVGWLRTGDDAIRLTGRDADTGVDVALSIPVAGVDRVRVAEGTDDVLGGERTVVLELGGGPAILLSPRGVRPLHVHVLARRLGALVTAPPLVAQGG